LLTREKERIASWLQNVISLKLETALLHYQIQSSVDY
jgi:hypothetical protein